MTTNKLGDKAGPQMLTVDQAEVAGKRVVVRLDWNVTIGKTLQIVDDTRIVRTLPTIKWLILQGAKQIVLLSHLGKSGEGLSIEPVTKYASELLGQEIILHKTISDCRADTNSPIVMLENVRMWAGEDKNEDDFVRELASLGEIYVNEAFGECHRMSASIVGITKYLPSYGGMWLVEEVETILRVRDHAEHPWVVVMGGAKVEDKIKLIEVLTERADVVLLGGKLANEYQKRKDKIPGSAKILTPVEGVDLLDIGEATRKIYANEIAKAKTIVWNGPMGKVEDVRYRAGTLAIFEAIASNTESYSLVGGGDTLAAVGREEQITRIDHVSTGGGAMLALLERGELPGISVLES